MGRVPRVRRRKRLGFSYRFAVVLLYPLMRTFVKWDIRGSDRLTDEPGGVIAAPNHISWFDPLVVSYVLWTADRPPRFLAKEAMFRIPVIGRIIANAEQIPVYRDSTDAGNAIRDALTALDAGECVVVYPEGTITRDPSLWPMSAKTGAVRLALMSGRPLIPIAQWGAQEVMGPYRKEFRILPRKTVHVRVGPPVDLQGLSSPPDTHTLAEGGRRLMDAITDLLSEIRQEPAPATRFVFHRDEKGSRTAADSRTEEAQ
jgi:1-acyl-sn-glycerol-3-phosphate acyltransferase